MLIISEKAVAHLEEKSLKTFIGVAIERVTHRQPDWASKQPPGTIKQFCTAIQDFSRRYDLDDIRSFDVLTDLMIHGRFDLRPTDFQHFLLSRAGFSEELRMREFYADLSGGSRGRMVQLPDFQPTEGWQ